MRAITFRGVCGLTFILLAGCQAQGTFSQADLDAAEAAVAAELEEFWAAWEPADMEAGMAFYSDSPDHSFINDGVIWDSKTAASEAFRPAFEAIDHQEFDILQQRILALTPEVVLVTIGLDYTQMLKTGESTGPMTVGFTMVWVQEGGEWRSLAYNFSSTKAPPASMRSFHLLAAPSGEDEAAYARELREINLAIKSAGYPGNGYDLWKVGDAQDPEYEAVGAGLILEGSWTNQEAYDLVHGLDVYQTLPQETQDLFGRVASGQRYTRFVRVPVAGPGEG